jgi:hypothetical protein
MASRSSPSRQKAGTSRPISEAQEISDGEELFASPEIALHSNAGHRERLRARFLKSGAGSLPDYELLELTLFAAIPRRDTKPLAKQLLARFGSYPEVIAAPRQRLMEVAGVGEAVVNQLKIVEAAAARLTQAQVIGKPALSSWSALVDYCMATMARPGGRIPGALSLPQECPDRRRSAGEGHGRSRASLSPRDHLAGAGTWRLGPHPGAQSSQRRSHALQSGHRHDAGDR